jgi:hypothetical protein
MGITCAWRPDRPKVNQKKRRGFAEPPPPLTTTNTGNVVLSAECAKCQTIGYKPRGERGDRAYSDEARLPGKRYRFFVYFACFVVCHSGLT